MTSRISPNKHVEERVADDVAGREEPHGKGQHGRHQRTEEGDRECLEQGLDEKGRVAERVGRHHEFGEAQERHRAAGEPHGRDIEPPQPEDEKAEDREGHGRAFEAAPQRRAHQGRMACREARYFLGREVEALHRVSPENRRVRSRSVSMSSAKTVRMISTRMALTSL